MIEFSTKKIFCFGKYLFSAKANGTDSKASEKARKAYCSKVDSLSASLATARLQLISAAPPPKTILLSYNKQEKINNKQKII